MKRSCTITLFSLVSLALAAMAPAGASAELPEYLSCAKAAKVGKGFVGHYASALCTSESKVETGGEYELEKGFGKKATFTARSGRALLASPEVPEKMECKTTVTSGEFTGSKGARGVTIQANGCEAGGSKCNSVGQRPGHILTNPLKGEFGYIAGKGTSTPTVGLMLSQEGTTYASEFTCEGIEVRTQGPIIAEVTGNINQVLPEATYSFRESGGVQQFTSFEGSGPFEDEWHWEFNQGEGFKPEGGDPSGLELTGASNQGTFEIKA